EIQRLLDSPEHQGLELSPSRQIYTNRALQMDQIGVVGFDMDYTLAVYSMRQIEELAFHMTLDRLVAGRGYREELRNLKYDHEYVIRGLVVDKDYGNIFKMDRHNHVGRCYHGRRQLSLDERRALYQTNEKIRLSLPRFAWMDTLFSLPEACLFAEHRPFIELNPNGTVARREVDSLERGRIYEGGNLFDFERMSGFAGDRVLYVGDHIYGDIIRNRKASQWRTCFIVQELEREIEDIEE